MKPVLGFIGLGIMGKPMVRNLLKAGYTVRVYSIVAQDVEEIVRDGAVGQASARAVAEAADITITMVPNTPQVEDVLFGENGLASALREGKVVIDMSTISSLATRNFAEKIKALGADMLDAPVSGGDKGAKGGTLSIMVGGEADVFARCKPILEVLGSRVTHVGSNGAGQVVKSCNQVLAAATMAALGEALVMGTKAGVNPAKIVEVLSAGYARCGALDIRGNLILERNFDPGFMTRLQYKDLNLAMELSQGIDSPMPIASLVRELYKSCMAQGTGNEDHSNIIKVFEQLSGIEVQVRS
ncbi:NAD-binding protein [Citrobacter freundii]|uniref:NAD(P)-dependent oxidoreductase n=1 Tax=Citrobacter freundii TaxID=546 RepID=UPI001902C70E|nr:NAD(P)-binding domain-containing protein [Citrobacter freundii]ELP2756788.1 NAD-binding protein [Klebsiella oxytoca]EMA4453307.1 NAD-binding protein [Citrobacter freundii]MBJ9307777.1 NAD-binding protein [Citrobacter freundii]HEC2163573.1 NAD-binding protein [Klebsiella oxytoca]